MQESELSDLKACPTCKICDRGTLIPRKIRRLNGPAVAIGYILLVPSILGMVGCAILLIITVLAGAAGAAGVAHGSALVIAFAGIGSLVILYVAVVCFVGGLLGWLLVMRKYVLQCDNCGAVVNAAASVAALSSNDPWTTVTARGVIVGVLFLLFFIGIIWASIEQAGNSGSIRTTPTTTTAEPAQPLPNSSTAAPAQPSPDNTAAAPAISDTWLPFTSVAGGFSALFPGTLHFGSEPTHWKNGEPGTLYKVFAVTHDGKPNQTGYVVMYTDFTGDAAAEDAQTHLQNIENDFFANKTRLGEQAVDLNGVPGRAYTAADSQLNYAMRDFVTRTRVYWVIVVTPKGYTASQANRFLNSFRILDNPPTAVDNSTASSQTPVPEPAPEPTVKPAGTLVRVFPTCRFGGIDRELCKPVWKKIKADGGEAVWIDLHLIRDVPPLHYVWVYTSVPNAAQNPYDLRMLKLNCQEQFKSTGGPMMYAPPRSITGEIAATVCAK